MELDVAVICRCRFLDEFFTKTEAQSTKLVGDYTQEIRSASRTNRSATATGAAFPHSAAAIFCAVFRGCGIPYVRSTQLPPSSLRKRGPIPRIRIE